MRAGLAGLKVCTTTTTALSLFVFATAAAAHPVPFSYLDLQVRANVIEGTFVAHVIDVAHDLRIAAPGELLDPATLANHQQRIAALLGPRIRLTADDVALTGAWGDAEPLADRQAVRVRVRFPLAARPGRLRIGATAFPYDPNHETFLNIYEADVLTLQAIFDRDRTAIDYYTSTRQGTRAVIATFVPAGIHHIAIGPDHLLFLVGLLLVGGTAWQLVRIVTAFTIGHSLTLALAALDVVSLPPGIVEPAIAMSIVYIGVDNLAAPPGGGGAPPRNRGGGWAPPLRKGGRDVRGWVALAFGLIHGFGFASVLKEFGLPGSALGWSLFSFNLGVEIGQLVVVILVTAMLAAVRQRSALVARRIAIAGSAVVVAAGSYWFIERVFFTGGI